MAIGFAACGGNDEELGVRPSASASGCSALQEGVPDTLDAEVHVLASGQSVPYPINSPAPKVISDGGDVYWYDGHGSVFVERQGGAGPVEVMRSEEPETEVLRQVVMGMAASSDRLYVGDGFKPTHVLDYLTLGDFKPPSRLVSLSKQDGRSEVLLESRTHTLIPIAADSERVIVFASGRNSGYHQVRLADPQLERLPLTAPFRWGNQLLGDHLYWVNDENPALLLRSGFDDVEPETVRRLHIDDVFFSVGPSYILTMENRILPGYQYSGKHFVLHQDSDCRALPAPRGKVFNDLALDGQHAYWYRPQAPPDPNLSDVSYSLFRVDVESGALTQLNTPGFTPEPYVQIAGQDRTRLFLRTSVALVAIRKP